ncbi:DUF1467 family protein [Brevundimonas sp.]|uniref:DUF1467 family protein n=1 Tax=Brevundimonas sp. TaxID=1871086 RepID=UPI0025CBB979|nr:DUF1467 family protein [Brevundimonas sp.]
MGPITLAAIYIICWWVVLFVVLPIGMNQGARERPQDGGDWGAPDRPNLKRKFITTTWIAAIVWLVVVGIIFSGVITLPDMSRTY